MNLEFGEIRGRSDESAMNRLPQICTETGFTGDAAPRRIRLRFGCGQKQVRRCPRVPKPQTGRPESAAVGDVSGHHAGETRTWPNPSPEKPSQCELAPSSPEFVEIWLHRHGESGRMWLVALPAPPNGWGPKCLAGLQLAMRNAAVTNRPRLRRIRNRAPTAPASKSAKAKPASSSLCAHTARWMMRRCSLRTSAPVASSAKHLDTLASQPSNNHRSDSSQSSPSCFVKSTPWLRLGHPCGLKTLRAGAESAKDKRPTRSTRRAGQLASGMLGVNS